MKHSVKIKICGLTSEVDVDLALSYHADFYGFIVYAKSPRGLDLRSAAKLASHIPIGKRVLVDVNSDISILSKAKDLGFDYFQIHCGLDVEISQLTEWSEMVGPERLWLAPRIGPTDAFPVHMLEFAQTILIDTYSKNQVGGTGETGDWGRFAEFKAQHTDKRFILAGGLGPGNVVEAMAATGSEHVDVNSGVESAPGVKDGQKLEALFKALR